MFTEMKVVRTGFDHSNKYDKIYLTMEKELYFHGVDFASSDIKSLVPQITQLATKKNELKVLLVIKKNTFSEVCTMLGLLSAIFIQAEREAVVSEMVEQMKEGKLSFALVDGKPAMIRRD